MESRLKGWREVQVHWSLKCFNKLRVQKLWSLWNDAWTHQTDPHHRVKGSVCVFVSLMSAPLHLQLVEATQNHSVWTLDLISSCISHLCHVCPETYAFHGWWRALWTASHHWIVLCPCVLEETVISILRIQLLWPLGKFRKMYEHHLCTFQRDLKNLLT